MREDPAVKSEYHFYELVRRFEMNLIERALIQANGKQRPAARPLGMKPSTLHAKIKLYNIPVSRFSRDPDDKPAADPISQCRLDADAYGKS